VKASRPKLRVSEPNRRASERNLRDSEPTLTAGGPNLRASGLTLRASGLNLRAGGPTPRLVSYISGPLGRPFSPLYFVCYKACFMDVTVKNVNSFRAT